MRPLYFFMRKGINDMKRILCILSAMLLLLSLPLTAFADYENTYANTGILADDIAAVALTQIGYTDSETASRYGGTKDSHAAALISWCAYEAMIADEIIIKTSSVSEMYAFFAYANRIRSDDTYTPKKGDILFIGKEEMIQSAAVVLACDNEYITAVTCDTDRTVKKKQYSVVHSNILGYAEPDYAYKTTYTVGRHITTASFLNFRTNPTTSSAIIAQIPMGTIVDIQFISGEWGKITYNGSTGWINMQYAVPYDASHSDTSKYGVQWNVIDVSKWQGTINWKKIEEANIQGVIFRIGLRGTKTKELLMDERFLEYYEGAKNAGLHVGCYFYSAAQTVAEAREEAHFIINAVITNGLEFDMPAYLDLEENMTYYTGRDTVRAITTAYLQTMDKANIYSGIYCNRSWAETFYTPDIFAKHPLWIAEYNDKCTYKGEYGMWQYTGHGSVSGIEENYTDLNICYINYPLLIADNGYNTQIVVPEPSARGDINRDGKITAADARLALRISAGLEQATDEQRTAADINEDGKITAADARKILRISAGLETI